MNFLENNHFLKNEFASSFLKRVCNTYVDKNGKCSGCSRSRDSHDNEISGKWTDKECTVFQTTDAFGEKQLSIKNTKKSKYIRIANTTEVRDFIQYMYSENGWGLEMPKLILSVTGGAQNFTVSPRLKKALKIELMRAAVSTNAWIITGGSNSGVMKLVGDAVADESHKYDLTLIGIATWSRVKNRELLKLESKVNVVPDGSLDSNHTNFILVDDGSEDQFGKEIEFRAKLEEEIRLGNTIENYRKKELNVNKPQIPMILIVVNGGPNTLKTVTEYVKVKIPVLILEGSGGCADLISEAIGSKLSFTDWKELIERHKNIKYSPSIEKDLKDLVEEYKRTNSLFNVFTLDNEDVDNNFDLTILHTFLNSQKTSYDENLSLTLKWNRIDIAKDFIFTGEEKISTKCLESLMEIAFSENKFEFVSLFFDHGIQLGSFLTLKRLESFYNSEKTFLYDLIERCSHLAKNENEKKNISFKNIEILLSKLVKCEFKFLPKDQDNRENFVCEENILIWAVLLNRMEIAKIILENYCQDPVFSSLLGSTILKGMATLLPDEADNFLSSAEEFENIAIGTLQCLVDCLDTSETYRFLMHKIDLYDMSILDIAVLGNSQKFLAQSVVQNYLTSIWHGNNKENSDISSSICLGLSCLSGGLLGPFLSLKSKSKHEKYKDQVLEFLRTPQVNFIYEVISLVMILVLFSYLLLCDFDFEERQGKYSITEIILLVWFFALVIEEIRQFVSDSETLKRYDSFNFWYKKVQEYLEDQWNYLDMAGILLFFAGIRYRSLSVNEYEFTIARVILCLSLIIWYFRLLHVTLVFKTLGPKLVMIRKMFFDLVFFIFIISIFICAFGVVTQASMFSKNEWNFQLLKKIINNAYWPIYGDTKILEDVERTSCDSNDDDCRIPHPVGAIFSYIATMIYMLIANVLLLNLLIAMFSSTFDEVNSSTNEIWKSQRFVLITDYLNSPLLPPPLNLIEIGFRVCNKTLTEYFLEVDDDDLGYDEATKLKIKFKEKRSCVDFLSNLKRMEREKTESKLKQNFDRLEQVEKKLNTLIKTRTEEAQQLQELISKMTSLCSKIENQ